MAASSAIGVEQRDRVSVYRGPDASGQQGKGPPVLYSIPTPTDAAEAMADHAFLLRLLREGSTSGPVPCRASFSVGIIEAGDICTGSSGASSLRVKDTERLLALMRRRIFDHWHHLFPAVQRLSGSFEIFNPSRGANMRWHQDGHTPGTFIAHLALLDDQSKISENMNWFEVALPSRSAKADEVEGRDGNDDDEEEETQYTVEMHTDEASIARIDRSTFVAFDFDSAALQRLVIFEDDGCYHRTPLTAHAAVHEMQQQLLRPIARFVFYAVDESGVDLSNACQYPPPAFVAEEPRAHGGHVPATISSLPIGLRAALEGYVASGVRANTLMTLEEAMEAYIRGDDHLIGWLTTSFSADLKIPDASVQDRGGTQ
jgi:hypothetical protein